VITIALGVLNTGTYNVVMGIPAEFSSTSILSWFQWGLSSLVAPVVYIAAFGIATTVLIAAVKLLVRVSTTAKGCTSLVQRRVSDFASERGLDEPNLGLQAVIGAGTLVLAGFFVLFWECLAPVTVYINDAPPAALAVLNPANEARFDVYGLSLDLLVFLYCLASYSATAAARKRGQPLNRWTRMSAMVVPVLALMMWEMPYRIVYHNTATRVDLASERCYQLAVRAPSLLLHCPDMAPPRNRIVLESDPSVRPRGVVESVFTPLASSHPTR
jgi:uncharacterized membrane protein YhdT